MAMRTRVGGSASIQYEDFQPKSEWKENEEANILHVHLPDFKKEQMKITYVHSSRTIRVVGERPITNNKWKRFNKVLPVPQNCEVSKIQGRFQDGVLIITMPKATITPVPKEEAKITKEDSTPTRTSATSIGKEGNEKSMTAVGPKPGITEPKEGKGLEETASYSTQKQHEGKKVEETLSPKEASKESKFQKGQEEASQKVAADSINQKTDKKSGLSGAGAVDQKISEIKEKASSELAVLRQKPFFEEGESSKKRKESVMDENDEGSKKRKELAETDKSADHLKTSAEKEQDKKSVKSGAAAGEDKTTKDFIVEKVKGMKDVAAAAAKKTVKGLNMEQLSEERQSLVNVGVAVLVIAAFGAYIAYSYRSSGNIRKN